MKYPNLALSDKATSNMALTEIPAPVADLQEQLQTNAEAVALRARFAALKDDGVGQAQFARKWKVPGGASMISQNINGRPISQAGVLAYARGFNCQVEDISPRLALELQGFFNMGSSALLQPNASSRSSANPDQSLIGLLTSLKGYTDSMTVPQKHIFDALISTFSPADLVVIDLANKIAATRTTWPFETVTPTQFFTLSKGQRAVLEAEIVETLSANADAPTSMSEDSGASAQWRRRKSSPMRGNARTVVQTHQIP